MRQNVLTGHAPYFALAKYINGKEPGCRLVMKAVMNAAAAGSAARSKTLNGNIQKAVMELCSGLPSLLQILLLTRDQLK